jgi:predicted DNA-binding protein (MmcQ/YjbR family)
MTVEELRDICLALPAVTEDIKWENHVCFSVSAKMFLITSPDMVPPSASFKVPEESFEELLSTPGFAKQTHLGRYHWVHLDDINRPSKREWIAHIKTSYELVVKKLPASKRKLLGI